MTQSICDPTRDMILPLTDIVIFFFLLSSEMLHLKLLSLHLLQTLRRRKQLPSTHRGRPTFTAKFSIWRVPRVPGSHLNSAFSLAPNTDPSELLSCSNEKGRTKGLEECSGHSTMIIQRESCPSHWPVYSSNTFQWNYGKIHRQPTCTLAHP